MLLVLAALVALLLRRLTKQTQQQVCGLYVCVRVLLPAAVCEAWASLWQCCRCFAAAAVHGNE